ncbi:MAG: type II secretion system protein GspG, partial [Planctomycetota bacterium]|nr:type II secretion system protein GspG [Planctomycetota bacterium]
MTCNRNEQHRQSAFTLVEILLVVVIIGILASVLVTSLAGRSQEARNSAAKSDIRSSLSVALDLFEQDCGRYPTEEEGLKVLV